MIAKILGSTAALVTVAMLASPAQAVLSANGGGPNGMSINGHQLNDVTSNALTDNGMRMNALHVNGTEARAVSLGITAIELPTGERLAAR
ncbi:hypothetical protein [Roseococcus sp. YIM B11640]|uniref:hypothetical protein n=1 Tax=Roseococcus sp. YIM B11640 TaxID=3133973 RepID=UPI003C7B5675